MKNDYSKFIICGTLFFSLSAFELNALVVDDSVETEGVLNATGGVRFPDGNLQSSACSDCENGILSITLGGTGANNALQARTNLDMPGLQTPNIFTADQNVAGTVNAASFSGNGSGITSLNASNLASGTVPDARLPSNLARKYGKVAVVAVSGGDYTSPVDAMTAIASWCGTPSDSNPCLMKIMPGVYNLGSTSLTMQPYVDIEGSGEKVTVITGTVGSASNPPPNGLVNGANNCEICFLTVRNTGGGDNVTAVRNSGASPRMTHMTAVASGGTTCYGVYNYNSSPAMNSVTAIASGGTNNIGVDNDYSSPAMISVTATASGGTYNDGVLNYYSTPAMNSVTAIASEGTISIGVDNYHSSPAMTRVTATASGGTNFSCGVYNGSSSPAMTGVTVTASGDGDNYAVYNYGSSMTMTDVISTASGDGDNYAVYNYGSSMTMTDVISTASGGTYNYGLYNSASSGAYTLKIDRSTFSGSSWSVYISNEFILRIGASNLSGGPVAGEGTYNCVGVYDGDTYTALNATCR